MAILTQSDVVNQALQLMGGDTPTVQGVWPNFTGGAGTGANVAAKAANLLYSLTVRAVMRQSEFDFARNILALTLTANVAPSQWALEYAFPVGAVEIWSIYAAADDPNNPIPYNFNVGNAVISGVRLRVLWTNLASAIAVYNGAPSESAWDELFQQAVVRLLSSALAMALAGKPDVAESMLQSGAAFENLAETRQN